jgi:DNA-binding response OmpR family regulator
MGLGGVMSADIGEFPALRMLIIEDNIDIAENIGDYLQGKGHQVDFAMDGISGLHLSLTQRFDAIVLDLMLPGLDGLTLCRELKKKASHEIPVLMLTARDTLSDKLKGFEAGADDYLVKPFALEELAARIGALTRRGCGQSSSIKSIGDLQVDPGKMEVRRAGQKIELNPVCFKILMMLFEAHPNVVTRREIEHALWGDMPPGSDALRSHIYSLRRAIDRPFKSALLETIHGVGYKLVIPHEVSS